MKKSKGLGLRVDRERYRENKREERDMRERAERHFKQKIVKNSAKLAHDRSRP